MLYTIPDYYQNFKCTADECEDTCCAGWQIAIDRKSLVRYGKVSGKFRRRLNRSIRWLEGTFKQGEGGRCAFLNEENLCDLYSALGKESLCRTCRLYPRHIEEFEGVREVTLSISCPEVARILLKKEEPARFLEYEKEGEEAYEDFDLLVYSKLAEGREVMLNILRDRELGLELRTGLVLALAHDMQVRLKKGEVFSCDQVFERYQKEKARDFIRLKLMESGDNIEERYAFSRQMFQNLYQLELLREDWESHLRESEYLLYGSMDDSQDSRDAYGKMHQDFAAWLTANMPEWEIQCEQLLVYFIYTYFCGAVYDGRAYAKIQMAVVSVMLIYEMLAARWRKNEKQLDFEDVVEIVYRYSREVEHSDQNLEAMEQMMVEQLIPWFSKERCKERIEGKEGKIWM